jgi:urea carboxylase
MPSRFTFGGDEHLLVECADEMSLRAFFKSLSAAELIKKSSLRGLDEINAGNASYQVKFNPDLIRPADLLLEIEEIDRVAEDIVPIISTRVIEIPVFYKDPWTHETGMRFRERHQDPSATDLEYAASLNGYPTITEFITAHHSSPWFVSMVGFVAGCPWLYQMVERHAQIEVPKYLRPRTDTPRHTVGHGGCFACIYAVQGAGGYQMFGVTPIPIFDPLAVHSHIDGSMVFFRPGDIVKFKAIESDEYARIVAAVRDDKFIMKTSPVEFDLREFEKNPADYNQLLLRDLFNGD